jgi:hypothetical protein
MEEDDRQHEITIIESIRETNAWMVEYLYLHLGFETRALAMDLVDALDQELIALKEE